LATRAAHGWQSGLSDRITVQVMPPEQGDVRADLDAETKTALSVLNATPGIAHAALLSDAEIKRACRTLDRQERCGVGHSPATADRRHYHGPAKSWM